MQKIILCACIFSLSLCAHAAQDPWDDYEKVLASLPSAAAKTLDRGVNCAHLSGEINGDRSPADKAIQREMTKLRCESSDADISALKRQQPKNNAVIKAIETYYDN